MKGKQEKIDFRGGSRPGSGRKKIGAARQINLTLPPEWWEIIDDTVSTSGRSQTDIIREMLHNTLGGGYDYQLPAKKTRRAKE